MDVLMFLHRKRIRGWDKRLDGTIAHTYYHVINGYLRAFASLLLTHKI